MRTDMYALTVYVFFSLRLLQNFISTLSESETIKQWLVKELPGFIKFLCKATAWTKDLLAFTPFYKKKSRDKIFKWHVMHPFNKYSTECHYQATSLLYTQRIARQLRLDYILKSSQVHMQDTCNIPLMCDILLINY